ncbi:MAG: hypothetical protein ACO1RT_10120 [Planctomycetaceae bacterium]
MRPELPDYGCFPRWPAEGSAWIHPDDRATVMHFIPGDRVFRRDRFDGVFYHYRYGEQRFRLKPCMWLPLAGEGVDIHDLVETVGLGMERDLFVATVVDAIFASDQGRCVYRLSRGGTIVDHLYGRDEFKVLTDKTKLRAGETIHPAPVWVQSYASESSLLVTEVEPDDGASQ